MCLSRPFSGGIMNGKTIAHSILSIKDLNKDVNKDMKRGGVQSKVNERKAKNEKNGESDEKEPVAGKQKSEVDLQHCQYFKNVVPVRRCDYYYKTLSKFAQEAKQRKLTSLTRYRIGHQDHPSILLDHCETCFILLTMRV